MKNFIKTILLSGVIMTAVACSVEPTFYSQLTPENFYMSQNAVWQRFDRPFTHWRYYVGSDRNYFELQELGTDELCIPTRGSDWYNGAVYQKFHHHEYSYDMTNINNGWSYYGMGVALAWDALEDLSEVDFDALGFEEGTKESMQAQLQTLVAEFYLRGLDLFGGCTLYTTTQTDVVGRSTDKETFEFIDSLLDISIPNLPLKTLGEEETSVVHRAVGAALKMRLYFNAEAYIGTPMYTEAAQIAQDIINGVYGEYKLADTYQDIFGFTNETCTEMIWCVPSENSKNETYGNHWTQMAHYNTKAYLGGLEDSSADNGTGLCPSRDAYGNLYDYKLGGAYEKFNDQDLRKKQYVYYGDGEYEGIFLVGYQQNPVNEEWYSNGSREYSGEIITMRDQVGYFAKLGTDDYPTLAEIDRDSDIAHAEESSCVRCFKVSPRPTVTDKNLMGNPDTPIIRLTECYYTLAECKMRAGDLAGAAELINTVRKRYFEGGNDPDPVTAANLDKYRMLDEWMVEFLCEQRRRTDLVRWDAYVTEDWWDHKATNNENLNRFPIHYSVLDSNSLLEQNPGY